MCAVEPNPLDFFNSKVQIQTFPVCIRIWVMRLDKHLEFVPRLVNNNNQNIEGHFVIIGQLTI